MIRNERTEIDHQIHVPVECSIKREKPTERTSNNTTKSFIVRLILEKKHLFLVRVLSSMSLFRSNYYWIDYVHTKYTMIKKQAYQT